MVLIGLAIIAYVLASLTLWQKRPRTAPNALTVALIGVAIGSHAIGLQQQVWQSGLVDLGLFNVLSLLGLMLATLVLLNRVQHGQVPLGAWLLPISALTALLGWAISGEYSARTFTFALATHIGLALLAYAMFAITLAYALFIKYQNRALKSHNLSALNQHMPPLLSMEQTLFRLGWIAFALLTLAILVGYVSFENIFGQRIGHKIAFTSAAWLMFAGIFIGHLIWGWRAAVTFRWLFAGFVMLSIGFFAPRFLFEFIL